MIIPLDDKLRIRGTEHCWQLERLQLTKGKPDWKPFKYFTTVDSALHSAAQRELRVYPTQTTAEAFGACVRWVRCRATVHLRQPVIRVAA